MWLRVNGNKILDDKSMCCACSLRVKLRDLAFSEMRRIYSIKFKKALSHRHRNHREELQRVGVWKVQEIFKELSV